MEYNDKIFLKLDEISSLLKHLLAIELSKGKINHGTIAKHLRVAKAKVGGMLKGLKDNNN